MPRVSGLWRLDAFLDGPPSVDFDVAVAVVTWVMALAEDPAPPEAVGARHPTLGIVFTGIVGRTDVEVAYRLMATGTPTLLSLRRIDGQQGAALSRRGCCGRRSPTTGP